MGITPRALGHIIGTVNLALVELPATCPRHGARTDPPAAAEGARDACCIDGMPAVRRRRAVDALRALAKLGA